MEEKGRALVLRAEKFDLTQEGRRLRQGEDFMRRPGPKESKARQCARYNLFKLLDNIASRARL